MANETQGVLLKIASDLLKYLKAGKDIARFSFETIGAEIKPWQESPINLDAGALTHSVFISYPHFRLPHRAIEIRDSIIIDSDLSGLGHPGLKLINVLVIGTKSCSKHICVKSGEDIPFELKCPGRKKQFSYQTLFSTKTVEVIAGKGSSCKFNLPFELVRAQLAERDISLARMASDHETKPCSARGICLEDSRISGTVLLKNVDLTGCSLQNAGLTGLLKFSDCLLDGAYLGSLHIAENARLVVEASSGKMQDISGIFLSGTQKPIGGFILFDGVRIRNSVIGQSEAGKSTVLALDEGTHAVISQSNLTDVDLDLSRLGCADELKFDSCQMNNVTINGLHHLLTLDNCRGQIRFRDCKDATLLIMGSAEKIHLELVNCERISIKALDGTELSLSLINSSLGKSLQILSSPRLEFTAFDERSSILIEDAESTLGGSKVFGLELPQPKCLLIGSNACLSLAGAKFTSCKLRGAGLVQSVISDNTEFSNCDLTGSVLGVIDKVHFSDCDLSKSRIQQGTLVRLSGKTHLHGLRILSEDLIRFTFDELPEEEIKSLDLDRKHLHGCSFKGILPDFILSGTTFDSCTFAPKQEGSWAIRSRASSLPASEIGEDSDTPTDAIQIKGKSRFVKGTRLEDTYFCGCIFDSSSFWAGDWSQHLSFERCSFLSDAIAHRFPWHAVDKISNCHFSGASISSAVIKAHLFNVRFSSSQFKKVSFCGDGKKVDVYIGDNSQIDGLSLQGLDEASIRVIGSNSCNKLIVAENKHVGLVRIEKTPIESLRINGAVRPEQGSPSIEVIALHGVQTKTTLAENVELRELRGTRLDLKDVSFKKLVIGDSQFSPDSSVHGVSARKSSLIKTNLLGLPAGRVSGTDLTGSSLTSIELKSVISDHMESGLVLFGCDFAQCQFSKDALLHSGQTCGKSVSFEGSRFDSSCEFTQRKMIGPVNFDRCSMGIRMDGTSFLECSFKGSVFSTSKGKARTIHGCCFENCEFDQETKFENCTIVGSDSCVFNGKESGPHSMWHPTFGDVTFETMTFDGAQFGGSTGKLVFRYCGLLNCTFKDGPSEVEFFAGSIANTAIRCSSLESLSAYSTDFTRVCIDDLSLKADFTFRQCNVDLKFIDRRYTGNARFTICQLIKLVLERVALHTQDQAEEKLCDPEKLTAEPAIAENGERTEPILPDHLGELIIEKCRILRPTDRESIALVGYTKSSPPTFTLEALLYGKNLGDFKSHLLEIGKLRKDLTKKDWVADVQHDKDWYDQLEAEMGTEEWPSVRGTSEIEADSDVRPFGSYRIEALKSLVLQRLSSIRHYEWQAESSTEGLSGLLSDIDQALVTPGILSKDAQELYTEKRQELIDKIESRKSAVEGTYDYTPDTKSQLLMPQYCEQQVRDLLTAISLSVGANTPSSNEPLHIRDFLNEILAGENFRLLSPDALSNPILDGRAFIYLDTYEFGRLIKNKVLHNIRKHVPREETGLPAGPTTSPIGECGIEMSSTSNGIHTLLNIKIWDTGPGFGKRQDEVRTILNSEKYSHLRRFCARFCCGFKLRTKCRAEGEGNQRSSLYNEFFLKSDGKIDFSASQAMSKGRGTEYTFCFHVEVS